MAAQPGSDMPSDSARLFIDVAVPIEDGETIAWLYRRGEVLSRQDSETEARFSVLLDAAGRTRETELTAAEGEQLYKTWELIKANPLLEKVYRGIVMQLLDKLDRK